MFRLSAIEKAELVANCDRFKNIKHSTALPYAFTEHGAIMLASVLNTPRAIEASLFVVRAFVKLREALALHKDLEAKLKELEGRISTHDEAICSLFEAMRRLMAPPPVKERRIGFDLGGKR